MAGLYSWVASVGCYCIVCSPLYCCFCVSLVSSLGIRVESHVRVNSVKLF